MLAVAGRWRLLVGCGCLGNVACCWLVVAALGIPAPAGGWPRLAAAYL
jgi:hypothetical protein